MKKVQIYNQFTTPHIQDTPCSYLWPKLNLSMAGALNLSREETNILPKIYQNLVDFFKMPNLCWCTFMYVHIPFLSRYKVAEL
jgi:hypothetical protein